MRIPALAVLAAVFMAVPARGQTYNPDYPVCLQIHVMGGAYIECGYTSLAQCSATASGRAAQCITNPFFAGAQVGPHYRRQGGVY